jgi:hypothetical protein
MEFNSTEDESPIHTEIGLGLDSRQAAMLVRKSGATEEKTSV